MEIDEGALRRIAGFIVRLESRITLTQSLLIHMGLDEKVLQSALDTADTEEEDNERAQEVLAFLRGSK